MVSDRQKQLLKLVIESHIKTGEPIGSKFLVSKKKLGVSDATVRNEMRDLEESGFLTHPHTSAGRVPTETGYQFYISELMGSKKLSKKIEETLHNIAKENAERKDIMKFLARSIAEETGSAVIIAFTKNSVYYTGIAHLFSQPEFRDVAHTVSISSVFDHCEDHLEEVSDALDSDETVKTLVGSKNPLGKRCSFVTTKTKQGELFGVLGPMRMNYKVAIPVVDFINKHI